MDTNKKLTRSSNKMIAGVGGGIAKYFNIDPTIIRIGYVLLSLASAAFPGIIVYLIMMLVMPEESKEI